MAETDREAILARLRAARPPGPAGERANEQPLGVEARLRERPVGPQPSQGGAGARLAVFTDRLEAAAATWTRAADGRAAVEAIADYLNEKGVVEPPIAADHPALRALPWPVGRRPAAQQARGDTAAALTVAALGIAETGSLLLCAGPQTPTRLNFLPDILICLLASDALVDHLEDAWAWLRARGPLPRAVNLVTGPSRTADVEQTIQLGAHGPRHLHVVLVDAGLGIGK